jgi:alginate O-acetyltransferase complex protein AlgI
MVFTSPTFAFLFLPLVLFGFFAMPVRVRTPFLVLGSLLFYAWGEKQIVFLLIASILLNWALALLVERITAASARRLMLVLAVALNIGGLLYFKYTNFFVANLNALLAYLGRQPLHVAPVHLPIGISFVTFEALSYVIDVYRRDTRPARDPFHVAFYVSFFPHLIAGPILRFRDIAAPLPHPRSTFAEFDGGISRFITGLAKKMLLANPLGHVADQVFALNADQLGTHAAWLGIVCYALQIYFDFSGYSDMAIGLGHLFGFTLPENFRLPYAAQSIKEFWRRWHISLSSWFRDYLFIPLGGSRHGTARTYLNLFVVFLLCGFWHGASWNFVVWGAFHGAFLVLERTPFGRFVDGAPRPLRHAYTMLVVLVGWVFFRAESFTQSRYYLAAMFRPTSNARARLVDYVTIEVALALAIAVVLATAGWRAWLERQPFWRSEPLRTSVVALALPLQLAMLLLSLIYVAAGTYNPFIYFRF